MPNKMKQPKLNRTQLSRLKVRDLQRLLPGGELDHGNHDTAGATPAGVCLMEAVAWVAGEPHSDHPECACPVLTDIGISINDETDNEGRQRLIPAIPALVGSKTGSKRTYFKRVKLATQRVLQAQLGDENLDSIRRTQDDAIVAYAIGILQAVQDDRRLTRTTAKRTLDALRFLRDRDDVLECEESISLLEKLVEAWDPDGIPFAQYERILGDIDFVGTIPDDRLPDFFVELATTHA